MKNMKLLTQIVIGFATVVMLLVGLRVFSLWRSAPKTITYRSCVTTVYLPYAAACRCRQA
jgi:hypothetical protein